jgi:spore coat protein U-like protein
MRFEVLEPIMKRPSFLQPIVFMAMLVLAAPSWGNGNNCLFQARGLSMGFGTLDPASNATVIRSMAVATLNADSAGDCAFGQTMVISGGNGQNFNGSRRMTNGADFIAYDLALPTAGRNGPGNGNYVAFTFNGTVVGSAYADASPGLYSDTVVISVSP